MIAAIAARAALALAALAAAAVLVRRRRGGAAAPLPPVSVLARAPLGAGVGVALVEAGGSRLLVGWGKDGVRLVRDLGGPPRGAGTGDRDGERAITEARRPVHTREPS